MNHVLFSYLKVLKEFGNIKWTMTQNSPLRIGFHLRKTRAAKYTIADDESSAWSSQSHGGDKWQHIRYVLATWYGNEKGQHYFWLCCTKPHLITELGPIIPVYPVLERQRPRRCVEHECTRMIDKWVEVPSRASAVSKDFRWGKFQWFLELAYLGMCTEAKRC